jgi:hypothetical protein
MPRLSPPPAQRERERRLWGNLHAFIRNHDGSQITSKPDCFPARMECRQDSELPNILREQGWILANGGTNEVFLPVSAEMKLNGINITVARDHLVPTTVAVWEIFIP